jgi:hypothetical protein
MKQTAVEWFIEELFKKIDYTQVPQKLIDQAKEMEKEQIMDAHGEEQSKLQDDGSWKKQTDIQYYNETHGGK